MTISQILFLFVTGLVGGVLNSVAGGGSFIGLPALINTGVTPVVANATTTLAFWFGSVSSVLAYRRELGASRKALIRLCIVSLGGGLVGALLLVRTSDGAFLRLLPWLMLVAAATFTFGGRLAPRRIDALPPSGVVPTWALLVQFVIGIYGGFFGGGIGIMMLATMSLAGMTDIHEMNGLKTVLAAVLNGVALVVFVIDGSIAWAPGIAMMTGGVIGGYSGAAVARLLDRRQVRMVAGVIAWVMTIYFLVR